jgi:Flp pilus assembly pilin Flp
MMPLKRFIADDSGATAIEYSLIIILISTVVIGGYVEYASSTSVLYGFISNTIAAAAGN